MMYSIYNFSLVCTKTQSTAEADDSSRIKIITIHFLGTMNVGTKTQNHKCQRRGATRGRSQQITTIIKIRLWGPRMSV